MTKRRLVLLCALLLLPMNFSRKVGEYEDYYYDHSAESPDHRSPEGGKQHVTVKLVTLPPAKAPRPPPWEGNPWKPDPWMMMAMNMATEKPKIQVKEVKKFIPLPVPIPLPMPIKVAQPVPAPYPVIIKKKIKHHSKKDKYKYKAKKLKYKYHKHKNKMKAEVKKKQMRMHMMQETGGFPFRRQSAAFRLARLRKARRQRLRLMKQENDSLSRRQRRPSPPRPPRPPPSWFSTNNGRSSTNPQRERSFISPSNWPPEHEDSWENTEDERFIDQIRNRKRNRLRRIFDGY